MTDMTKYKNVSLTKETYAILEKLSKVLLPDAKLSISKTIESIANEKAKKLNGKVKKARVQITICPTCKGNGYLKVATETQDTIHQCWDCDSEESFMKRLLMVLSMMVLLTNCTKIKFDGYDPSTAMVRWIFTSGTGNR